MDRYSSKKIPNFRSKSDTRKEKQRRVVLILGSMGIFWLAVIIFITIQLTKEPAIVQNANPTIIATIMVNEPEPTESPGPIAAKTEDDHDNAIHPTLTPDPNPTATYDPSGLDLREIGTIINVAQNHIVHYLDVPTSTIFPNVLSDMDQWKVSRSYDVVTVQSYVDTQDSFGSKLRYDFILQMSYESGNLTYLELDGEVITGSAQPIK